MYSINTDPVIFTESTNMNKIKIKRILQVLEISKRNTEEAVMLIVTISRGALYR